MMETALVILAYILTFALGPLVASLVGFVTLPLVALLRHVRPISLAVIVASSVAQGIVAVWIGRLIFSWLNQPPTILMALILAAGYAVNDFRRVRSSTTSRALELGRALGALAGIGLGALLFLA